MIASIDRLGSRAALVATVLLPLVLIHARSVAEGLFAALAVSFVLRCALMRDWSAFRQAWVAAAMGYWAWLVVSTLVAGAEAERLTLALAWGRVPLAVLAISCWVLADQQARRWLLYGTGIAVLWVALEVWLQLIFGRGIRGFRRWPAGELPGPFARPRAGPFMAISMWAPLLHATGLMLARSVGMRLLGWALAAAALMTMVFIGQRMPLVLTLFGFGIAALLMRGLLLPALMGVAAGALALATSAVLAPNAFHRLAVQFPNQLMAFGDSHYGQILARALEMIRQNPLFGLGARGFREGCLDPTYYVGWTPGSDGGGAGICVTHAHNAYLEAATDAGLPGLVFFAAMALLILLAAFSGLRRGGAPLRIGLFISTLVPLWPISSTSGFTSMPNGGMWMLLAGWALAEARASKREQS